MILQIQIYFKYILCSNGTLHSNQFQIIDLFCVTVCFSLILFLKKCKFLKNKQKVNKLPSWCLLFFPYHLHIVIVSPGVRAPILLL